MSTPSRASRQQVVPMLKVDDEQRMIWGWASVATKKGVEVEDRQGDIVEVGELVSAAHEFMDDYRMSREMHKQDKSIGTVVESMVFTKSLQDALGIDLDMEGWLIGVRVDNDEVWKGVKSGKYRAFSIGGSGERHEVA